MRGSGYTLIAIGILLMVWATGFFPVTLDALAAEPMANIDLIGQRELVMLAGGFTYVSGWVAMAADHIARSINAPTPSASTPNQQE